MDFTELCIIFKFPIGNCLKIKWCILLVDCRCIIFKMNLNQKNISTQNFQFRKLWRIKWLIVQYCAIVYTLINYQLIHSFYKWIKEDNKIVNAFLVYFFYFCLKRCSERRHKSRWLRWQKHVLWTYAHGETLINPVRYIVYLVY